MSARENLVAVIMAGGIGSRFGPINPRKPQTISQALWGTLASTEKLRQNRIPNSPERVLILTQERFRGLVNSQLPDIPDENIYWRTPSARYRSPSGTQRALDP